MPSTRAPFGALPDGTAVEAITLANGTLSVTVLTYGATLQALHAPDRNGTMADVLLGSDDLPGYLNQTAYFGATIGRYANRIAHGRFTLDGQAHQLPLNNGPNTLHGGVAGFDRAVWKVAAVSDSGVTLAHASPDGDQGFPGTLEATATFALEGNALTIDYAATTDRPTIVNLTNHAYFNLSGQGSILAHRLTIPADAYTPVDATLIPTGELRTVAGTAFDFRAPRAIGDHVRDGADAQLAYGRGYDHNWALTAGQTAEPKLAARLEDPASGRALDLLSTEPGLQVYSGNFLDGTFAGKGGQLYRMGDAVALEPQKFPDSPNQPGFPSARLDPGSTYRHRIVYRLSADG